MRERLNTLYDAFVTMGGYFHENDNRDCVMQYRLGMEMDAK